MNIYGILGIITTNSIMSNIRQKKKNFEVMGKNNAPTISTDVNDVSTTNGHTIKRLIK